MDYVIEKILHIDLTENDAKEILEDLNRIDSVNHCTNVFRKVLEEIIKKSLHK